MREPWRLFDHLAPSYDRVLPYFSYFGRELVGFLDPLPGARLLDVGAGTGAAAHAALARGCLVTAVDAALGMVEVLAAELPEATVQLMNAESLSFQDGTFDLVTTGFVLHALDDPDAALSEAHRVLTPRGKIGVSLPAPAPAGSRWRRFDEIIAEFAPDDSHLGGGGPRIDVPALLRAAGFRDVTCREAVIRIPADSPETVWKWLMSQGFAGFYLSLDAGTAAELQRAVMAELEFLKEPDGIILERAAILHKASA
jgi:SAM-dependent methyltransferase